MFDDLQHRQILITGPGRSGTRICAKIVAHDTNLPYIDEVEVPELFIIGQEVQAILDLVAARDSFVLHCPTVCRYLLELPDDLFIIFMWRDLAEIQRSQRRVHVKRKSFEREYNKYGFSRYFKSPLPYTVEDISSIKQRYWTLKQKPLMQNYREIDYYSLTAHPLWLGQEKRRHFKWNQTEVG